MAPSLAPSDFRARGPRAADPEAAEEGVRVEDAEAAGGVSVGFGRAPPLTAFAG